MVAAGRVALLALLLANAAPLACKSLHIAPSPIANSRVALRFTSPQRPTKPAIGDVSALTHPTKAPPTSNAVPFITINPSNQTLALEPGAVRALAELPAPVCVMGITGTARDGKSTFLNIFSQWLRSNWAVEGAQGTSFNVGHDLDTCTDGAWIRLFRGRGAAGASPR
eukprot:520049-Prymnesium_polylepis.3